MQLNEDLFLLICAISGVLILLVGFSFIRWISKASQRSGDLRKNAELAERKEAARNENKQHLEKRIMASFSTKTDKKRPRDKNGRFLKKNTANGTDNSKV